MISVGIDHWYRLKEYEPEESIYAELKLLGRQYRHYIWIYFEERKRRKVKTCRIYSYITIMPWLIACPCNLLFP